MQACLTVIGVLAILFSWLGPAPAEAQTIGGRGFTLGYSRSALDRGVYLSWGGGTGQTGYLVLRVMGGAVTVFPLSGGTLSASTTTFYDPSTINGAACYVLLVLTSSSPKVSDLLCVIPTGEVSAYAPQYTEVRLNQSQTAVIGWDTPLLTLAVDGYRVATTTSPPGFFPLTAHVATHNTQGHPTCYVVSTMAGTTVKGSGDLVCAIPGVATVGAAATAAATGAIPTGPPVAP